MIDEKMFINILNSREERGEKQREVLKEYPFTLISFTLNTPGIIKDNELYRRIHSDGLGKIIQLLNSEGVKIKYNEVIVKNTGSEAFLSVDLDAKELKKLMISIETSHPLGRIFDIDIFDLNHNQISRWDIGLNPRKCLMCEKDAKVCMREKNHTYEELIKRIEEISIEYFKE